MRLPDIPRILRKIAVTVAVGSLTYFVTDLTELPGIWSLTMTILIGSIAFVVQFLVDVEARLTMVAQRTDESQQHVRVTQSLRDLGTAGELTYEGEDRDWLLALAEASSDEVAATSHVYADPDNSIDLGFWTSELGQRYFDVQVRAIRRGVRVRRVFVLGPGVSVQRPDLLRLQQQQQSARVEVRIWEPGRNPAPDIVIFDQAACYEVTLQPRIDGEGPLRLRTTLELRPGRVAERVQWFEQIWQRAEPPPVYPS